MPATTSETLPGYDSEAAFYGFAWDDFRQDLTFYRRQLQRGAKVLDCMCGTGRVALALARDGHHVDGIDSSTGMLRMARQRLKKERPAVRWRISFISGDLRSTALPGRYDAAIIALNSYGLILSRSDRIRALRHLRQALRRGGKLLMALDTVSSYRRIRDGVPLLARARSLPGGEVYVQVMAESGGQSDRVKSATLHLLLSHGGRPKRWLVSQTMTRVLSPRQVKAELGEAGFRLKRVFGDYDGRRYSSRGPRFILESTAA